MNTDTNSYREKGRAVFLAAIMVLSMVAGVAVFGAAPAAAQVNNPSGDINGPVEEDSFSATHYDSNNFDGPVVEVALDDGTTEFSGADDNDFALLDGDGNDLGSITSVNVDSGSQAYIETDGVLTDLAEVQFSNGTETTNVSVTTALSTVSLDSGNEEINDTLFSGGNVAVEVFDTPGGSVGDFQFGNRIEIDPEDGNAFFRNTGENSSVFVYDTADAPFGDYTFTVDDGDDGLTNVEFRDLGFNAATVGFDGEDAVVPPTENDLILVSISDVNDVDRAVVSELYEAGDDPDEDDPIATTSGTIDNNGDASLIFGPQEADDYFTVTRDVATGIEIEEEFSVVEPADGTVSFDESTFTTTSGDYVFIDFTTDGTDEFEFTMSATGYEATGTVTVDSEGDSGTIVVNTQTAGSSDSAFTSLSGDTDVSGVTVSSGASEDFISPASLTLEASVGGDRTDRARLRVQERGQAVDDQATFHVAPAGVDLPSEDTPESINEFLEAQTLTDTVAESDTHAALIQTSGVFGELFDANGDVDGSATGLEVRLEDADAGLGDEVLADGALDGVGGVEVTQVDQDIEAYEDADRVAYGAENQFLVEIEPRNLPTDVGYQNTEISDVRVVLELDPTAYQNGRLEDDLGEDEVELTTTTFTIEEPEIEFNTVRGDDYQLTTEEEVAVQGSTNLAPDSEISVDVVGEGDFTSETVEVDSEGVFEATFDLSGFDEDQEVELEASAAQAEDRDGNLIVGSIDAAFGDTQEQDFVSETGELEQQIADLEQQLEDRDTTIDELNNEIDSLTDERDDLQNDLAESEAVIGGLEDQVADLEDENADLEGQVADLEDENADLQDQIADLEDQIDELEEEDPEDDDDDGAGFGIAAALVALIGAALLAVRRRD